jgi:glycosyltransferase involved in cell wall biosynthesis
MDINISIILCCYNSAQRIVPTLEHLAKQQLAALKCEIILVDNNCTDTTVAEATKVWDRCGNPFLLKIVEASTPGLSSARKAGAFASSGEILIFCDDDNWLDQDYAQIAYGIMKENYAIGVLGGRSYPAFSIEPPYWFSTYQGDYAVGVQGIASGDISHRGYVWGAGAVVRRSMFLKFLDSGFDFLCAGRQGDKLSSGEDSEFCQWHLLAGLKLWYDERLIFSHYIPENRLTKAYLGKMHEGFAASYTYLKKYRYLNRAISMRADGIFTKSIKATFLILRYAAKIISKEEAMLNIQTIFPDNRVFVQDPVLQLLWHRYTAFKSSN